MSALSGALGGVIVLSTLELLLSSSSGTTAVGALAATPAAWLASFLDADTPLIPDHPLSAPAAGSSAATGGGTAVPASAPAPSTVPTPSTPTVLSV